MGFGPNAICFLFAAREAGVDFSRTLTLGRQRLHLSTGDLRRSCARMGEPITRAEADALFAHADGYADALLARLGARDIDAIDASPYEGASIVHDLNLPIPDALKGRFTTVIDGGTLEHVFDLPRALRSCMEMLAPGGHFLGMSPANNQMGHGFYQFSPELFYRVFSIENGFTVERMFVYEGATTTPSYRWYAVRDPQLAGRRVTLVGRSEASLLVQARKLHEVPAFVHPPQQSDYAAAWANGDAARSGEPLRRARLAGPIAAAKAWTVRHAPGLIVRVRRTLSRIVGARRFEKSAYAPVDVRRGLGVSRDADPWDD